MSDLHAYGISLFCVSRRRFIEVFSYVSWVVCIVQLISFVFQEPSIKAFVLGATTQRPATNDCIGIECYSVLSCYGFKETTFHMRNPFFYVFGVYFFWPGGTGCEQDLWRLHHFLLVLAIGNIAVLALDGLYIDKCGAYPYNVVDISLLGWSSFSPISLLEKEQLMKMASHPVKDVNQIVQGFNVLLRYYVETGLISALILYAAFEARALSGLVEKGPLGLGAHFGLAQWDEVLNPDAIRRRKERQTRSTFIDDARLPLAPQGDAEIGSGFTIYGSTFAHGSVASVLRTASEEHDDWGFGTSEDNSRQAVFQQGRHDGDVDNFLDAQEQEAKLAWHRFERRRQLA